MLDVLKREWKPVVLQAVSTALAIILLLIAAAYILPNRQQETLEDINNGTRAIVCVLALPTNNKGRPPSAVEECLAKVGL